MHGWGCPKTSHGLIAPETVLLPPLSPPPIGIRGGNAEWREFLEASKMCYWRVAALMDLHNVIDTFSWEEATRVAVDIDHRNDLGGLTLSKGRRYREAAFDPEVPYAPMITELDGKIFTDYDVDRRHLP